MMYTVIVYEREGIVLGGRHRWVSMICSGGLHRKMQCLVLFRDSCVSKFQHKFQHADSHCLDCKNNPLWYIQSKFSCNSVLKVVLCSVNQSDDIAEQCTCASVGMT